MDIFESEVENKPVENQPTGFGVENLGGEPKKTNTLKVVISILVVLVLGGLGIFGFVKYQEKQQDLKIAMENSKELDRNIELAVQNFSLLSLQEKSDDAVSNWDLNLSYAEHSEPLTKFVNTVASLINTKYDYKTGSVEVTYPNFEYVDYVIKSRDALRVSKYYDGLDKNNHNIAKDLTDSYADYLTNNLKVMLDYDEYYLPLFLKGEDVPKPYLKKTFDGVVSKGKVSQEFSDSLDKEIFSSQGFANSVDTYSSLFLGLFGKISETDEHKTWLKNANELEVYINSIRDSLEDKAEEGVYYDWTSDNSVIQSALDSRKELYLNEPIEYEFEVDNPKLEKVIPHSIVGVSYINSEESDAISTSVSRGDGSYDSPLTFGTPFETKMLGTDNNYHSVKVTVIGLKVGEDAIKEVLKYDEKNQGFTTDSQLVLATIDFIVENLEDKEIEVNSEFSLSDSTLNLVPRTGNMFSIPERSKIPPRGVVTMADWVYAKDTKTLALVWGKTFNRQFPAVFINALGNEVFDTYGRGVDRVSKKLIENSAQKTMDKLQEIIKERGDE